MSLLFRFEDTYGTFKLFCKAHGIKAEPTYQIFEDLDGIWYHFGLGNKAVFRVGEVDCKQYVQFGIPKVCFVFDVDHVSELSRIMDTDYLVGRCRNLKKLTNEFGISFRFIPCIYEAESLVLYQHLRNKIAIPSIVNKWSTRKLQQYLLCFIQGCTRLSQMKKFENSVDIEVLLNNYSCLEDEDKFNAEVMKLFHKEIQLGSVGLTLDESIALLKELHAYFEMQLSKESNVLTICGKQIDVLNIQEPELKI